MSGYCGRSSETIVESSPETSETAVYADESMSDVKVTFASSKGLKKKAEPLHISDAEFEKLISSEKKPVLVDFWAPWCRPCRMMGPVIDELAKEYNGKVVVAKMNVDKNPLTPRKFKIQGIPTILIFRDGKLVHRLVGYRSKSDFTSLLDKMLESKKATV